MLCVTYSRAAVCSCVLSNQPFSPPLSLRCTELSQSCMNVAWLLSERHEHTNSSTTALELGAAGTQHIHPVCMSRSFSVCVSLMAVNQLIFSHDTEVKFSPYLSSSLCPSHERDAENSNFKRKYCA